MATSTSTASGRKPASTRKTAAARKPAASTTTSTNRRRRSSRSRRSPSASSWCPSARASWRATTLFRASRGIATKYRTRAALEREIKRYERRGVTARNRFERQVRKTRTKFERELRQRRSRVERTVKQNRRRFEREVRAVRKDLERQSGARDLPRREAGLRGPGPSGVRLVATTSPAPAPGERRAAGKVRRPHILAGECSTLSSLNRRGVTEVAPRRSLSAEPGGRRRRLGLTRRHNASARMDPCPPETKYSPPFAP